MNQHGYCEVCSSELSGPRLDLGFHPLCDDLTSSAGSVLAESFHQEIMLCKNCLTAHQLHPVEKEMLFKPDYHYRSRLTKDVLSGMADLATAILNRRPTSTEICTILDIGCNDGSLLEIFKNRVPCVTIGVDPTNAVMEEQNRIDLRIQGFFDKACADRIRLAHKKIHVITFTNVFAHIENLPELIRNVSSLMSEETLLVIENHYLGAILERNQFDTFYHEHPRTYSLKSFKFIAKSMGAEIVDVAFPSRYGGNIRVTIAKNGSPSDISELLKEEEKFLDRFIQMQEFFVEWKRESIPKILELAERGPLFGKALPGRAVMLISALSVNADLMPVIFEQNSSLKVGFLVPGTQINVLADNEMVNYNPKVLILWAWHIAEEICEYLRSIGFKGEVWVPLPRFERYAEIE